MNKEQYLKQDEMTEIAALVEFLVGRKYDSYTYVKAVILTDEGGEDLGSIEIVPGDGTYAYYPNAPYSPATAQQRYLGETESGYEKRMRVQRDMKDLLDRDVLRTIPAEEWTTEEYRMMRAHGEVPVNSVDVAR